MSLLFWLRLPLYPFLYVGYVFILTLNYIENIPTTISKHNEKIKHYVNSPFIYVNFDTYTKYTGFRINHSEYKDYIYVITNNELVKAHLMVNKNTNKMAYVIDDISVCDDINKHKLTKQNYVTS